MSPVLRWIALLTAAGCATSGGVFFAFSSFVMAGLTRLPPAQGLVAMQSVNVTAVRPTFMTVLFAPALGCGAVAVHAARSGPQRPAVLLAAGAGLYLLAALGVTVTRSVPLNHALTLLDPADPASAQHWHAYAVQWTRWNSVRTAAALGAATALVLAVLDDVRAQPPALQPAPATPVTP